MFDIAVMSYESEVYLSKKQLISNKKALLKKLEGCGCALEYASDKLKDDKSIVLTAINYDELAIMYASDRLKNDIEVVFEAVKKNNWAIYFASKDIKELCGNNNPEIVLGRLAFYEKLSKELNKKN